ncbi:MAG: hypothetical protein LBG12_02920, partial [Synergistaceae bacterium]|nr:hypothetical protein [Synergistaceae bacterium]
MKKVSSVAVLAIALICVGMFIMSAGAGVSGAAEPAPIKIGEIATITGDFAAYGVAEEESVKIAVKEIN